MIEDTIDSVTFYIPWNKYKLFAGFVAKCVDLYSVKNDAEWETRLFNNV